MATAEDHDVNQTAAGWLVRLQRPDVAPQEREAFEAWVQAHPRNGVAFARAEAVWDRTARLSAVRSALAPAQAGLWNRRRVAGLAAASLVGGLLIYRATAAEAYETAIGGRKSIDLSDRSRLTLNTASRAKVRYSARRRSVDLIAGEALFEVAHDAARPFVVSTTAARFTAIGTAFNVRLRDGGAELCVIEWRRRLRGVRSGEQTPADRRPRLRRFGIHGDRTAGPPRPCGRAPPGATA